MWSTCTLATAWAHFIVTCIQRLPSISCRVYEHSIKRSLPGELIFAPHTHLPLAGMCFVNVTTIMASCLGRTSLVRKSALIPCGTKRSQSRLCKALGQSQRRTKSRKRKRRRSDQRSAHDACAYQACCLRCRSCACLVLQTCFHCGFVPMFYMHLQTTAPYFG